MELSTTELACITAGAEDSMRDECTIGTRSISGTGPSRPASYAYGSAIACGFDASKSKEVADGSQATLTDAVIRIPLTTVVTGVDRVQVTKRDLTALASPEFYAILGEPRRGISALVLNCKRIVGNSTL